MLKIINDLKPFFEDNYRRINVREHARIRKISPPTASVLLKTLKREGLLKEEISQQYHYYFGNRDNQMFVNLSRMYWHQRIADSGMLDYLEKKLISPVIILFGSLSKGEAAPGSDIDLAIFSVSKKELKLEQFEKRLKKKIQVFMFQKREDIKNPELLSNILNGYKLDGEW